MRLKLIKKNTVLIRRPSLNRKYGIGQELVPLICLSGKFLEGYGFEVGKRYEVYAQKERLLLKAKEFKYKNPIIKEVNKKCVKILLSPEPSTGLKNSGG